jgi:ADP-heptose:LPS heptosyltransferase
MMQLDLTISVDTAVAHLAGALGRPVWICLPATPEWRWMLDRTDTPWYASARLFRQRRAGEWRALFEEVASALRELVPERGLQSA